MGEPVRARAPEDQRGAARAAGHARARHARGLHPRAGGRARGAAEGARTRRPGPRLLRLRRRVGHRDRVEDGVPLLVEPGSSGQEPLRVAAGRLPRRDRGRAGRDRRRDLPRRLRAAGARVHRRAVSRPPCRRPPLRRHPRRDRRGRRAQEDPRRAPRGDRRAGGRAAGAGRLGHALLPPRIPAAGARALRPARGAAHRRRDHDRLRAHRDDVRVRAGRHRTGPDVPVERHHGRLPAALVRARDRRGVRRVLRRRGRARVPALAFVHRQPARVPRRVRGAGPLPRRGRARRQRNARPRASSATPRTSRTTATCATSGTWG